MKPAFIGKKLTVAVATALIVPALVVSVAHANELEPTPVEFNSSYGDMTFPEKFPDGTEISITQWSHFVPRYDEWFDDYAQQWGKAHNVKVTVDHIALTTVPSTLASAISAGQGPTLMETILVPSAHAEGLQPLNDVVAAAEATFGEMVPTCRHSSYLPTHDKYWGFCSGWVPVPGVYRSDLWKDAGYPDGPASYADLLDGGTKIFKMTGIPVGVGMSPEIDSELYARALIASFGGAIQDESENVIFDSPETVAAVEYMVELYKSTMTPAVFSWNAASNNQEYIADNASYIQNSLSFYRSAQEIGKPLVNETGFRPGLAGPGGKALMPANLWYSYVIPNYVKDEDKILAAKKFMLDLANNYSHATYYAKLYDFPAYPSRVPQLSADGGWLDNDPWGSEPADRLAIMKDAAEWSVWLGYPGYANPAISEIYQTFVLSTMLANAARGRMTPQEAVADAAAEMRKIFQKWRERGFVGGDKQ